MQDELTMLIRYQKDPGSVHIHPTKPESQKIIDSKVPNGKRDMLDLVSSQEGNSLGCPVFPIVFTMQGCSPSSARELWKPSGFPRSW